MLIAFNSLIYWLNDAIHWLGECVGFGKGKTLRKFLTSCGFYCKIYGFNDIFYIKIRGLLT